jgi:hypothetical protein
MLVDASLNGVSLGGTFWLADAPLRGASLSETLLLADALLRSVSLSGSMLLAYASHILRKVPGSWNFESMGHRWHVPTLTLSQRLACCC